MKVKNNMSKETNPKALKLSSYDSQIFTLIQWWFETRNKNFHCVSWQPSSRPTIQPSGEQLKEVCRNHFHSASYVHGPGVYLSKDIMIIRIKECAQVSAGNISNFVV